MSQKIMNAILDKIRAYDTIMLFRHVRNDGDCVGATKGLKQILKLSFPEKNIFLIDEDHSEYLAFLGPEDAPVSDEIYADALAIVLDTATADRISNKKYSLCKEVIKIDHHIPVSDYGCLNWVEEESSSVCEMVVKFYAAFQDQLKIDSEAATYLYTGMVTDSGRFRFSSVSGDTLRYAGLLLDVGIDTERLFAELYLDSFEYLKFKARVYEKMQITENGVAYIFIDKAMQAEFGLSYESAGTAIGCLDSIRGCLCWIAFIETDDNIRVRLRSRFAAINMIAEKYRGGGHACASGATVYNMDEVRALLRDADAHIKEYKETHEGWL